MESSGNTSEVSVKHKRKPFNNLGDIFDSAKAKEGGLPSADNPDNMPIQSLLDRRTSVAIIASEMHETKGVSVANSDKQNGLSETFPSILIRAPRKHFKEKLIILDVNGLLVDIVSPPKDHKADIIISRRAIFRRPFCLDFLKFCFERFEVGIWSSRKKHNLDRVVEYVMGDLKHNLLFCWDQSWCTSTKFNTPENNHKTLFLKELRKIWEKHDPELPWETGYYNKSNTLLLDDSPYKALLNPAHTAIFPPSYKFQDTNDNALGDVGELRFCLEMLAASDNVQKFVELNEFGQSAITEGSQHWAFYSQVIKEYAPSQS